MRRWIKRILLLLVLPLLVVVVGIQLVLWSDLPRSYLLETLEQQLGFRATIGRLETGWSGQTTLKDVSFRLPMQAEPFLTVARLEIAHSSLPRMLLGGGTIHTIHISEPLIRLEQDEDGSWNLERVWADLQASPLWRDSASGGSLWPHLEIQRARLVLKAPEKPETRIEPIAILGRMNDSRAWEFSAELPGQLILSGQIAPAGARHHRLAVTVEPGLSQDLSGWLPSELVPAGLQARWVGNFQNQNLQGKLDIQNLQLGSTQIRGRMQLQIQDDHIQLSPDHLTVTDAERFAGPLTIEGGTCRLEGRRLLAQEVVAEHAGVLGQITGQWNLATSEGHFQGNWLGTSSEAPTSHQGEYEISVHNPPRGRKDVQVHLHTSGLAAGGRWQAEVTARGFGPQWLQSQWQIQAPLLQWADRERQFRLDRLQGQLQVDADRIELLELKAPTPVHLEAQGNYTFADGRWSLELTAAGLPVEGLDPNRVDIHLSSRGDPNRIHIARLELRHPLAQADFSGSILLPTLQLERIRARATGKLPQESLTAGSAIESLQGNWRLDGLIDGGLRPAALQLQGKLTGTHLAWQKRPLGDLEIPWQSRYDPNERRLAFETGPFSCLDGRWKIAGHYGFDSASGDVRVQGRRIPLQSVCRIAKPELAWQAVLSADLSIPWAAADDGPPPISGRWRAEQIDLSTFQAEYAEGRLEMADGMVHLRQIHMRNGEGDAQAEVHFSLSHPERLQVAATLRSWPVELDRYRLGTYHDGEVEFKTDLLQKDIEGRGTLSSRIVYQDKPFGRFQTRAQLHGSFVRLEDIQLETLAGVITGQVQIPLDSWLESHGELQGQDLELGRLEPWWPAGKDWLGRMDGTLAFGPAETPRPPEPLELTAHLQFHEASFRGAQIQQCDVRAFAGPKRLLIEQSQTKILSGQLDLRAGLSRHLQEPYAHIHASYRQLDLQQLVRIFDPQAEPTAGKLAGSATLVVTSDPNRLTAMAEVQLGEADLMNNDIIALLYNALNLKFDRMQPEGQGRIKLYAEGHTLQIPSFVYSNRGVEVRGAGLIGDLTRGADSPIEGYAIATTRPLRELALPGIKQLDQLMRSLQTGSSSVQIAGTLGEPAPRLIPFPEIRSALRRLLWGQLRQESTAPEP